ncbi:hypothetical protein BHM03_00006202 [Ensete ventricosum]|uniref:Mon2/Sec7/BIG1-like dimerisation and cyclophilin-binding domain-containing protein n=1 Tax=Ensete ventricosum TaxID=4639 RepID=A0A445MBJ3_ENSVE|nr:hypothetical protein BHM03_00006202 [Ensete ventricosum]
MAAASAAAGFIIRSMEAMFKECVGKKYPALQSAVQTCLAEGAVAVKEGEAPVAGTEKDVTMNKSQETSEPIIAALASAGHTLDRTQAELVLKPLRLAFETKNIKLLEPALDCLHFFPRFSIPICTAHTGQYVSVRQVTGTRTAHYRMVPPKSTVGGRFRQSVVNWGRKREEEEEKEEKKKEEEEKNTSRARCRRPHAVAARGEKD